MAESSPSPKLIRILLLGDKATGKHCYTQHLRQHRITHERRPSTEVEVVSIQFQMDKSTQIPVEIINVGGLQRGKPVMQRHYQQIDGVIIMFDLTKPETFDNVIGWKEDIDAMVTAENPPIILLGNKCDRQKHRYLRRTIDTIDEYCHALGFLSFFETSAKENRNIDESIQSLIREIMRRQAGQPIAPVVEPAESSTPILEANREYTFKLLVIGEMSTGKSALIERYVSNTFYDGYRATIGSDIGFKKIRYNDNVIIRIHLWDVAGEERFGNMTHLFYRDAVGCLVVFDVTRPSTLDNGAVKWKADFDNKVQLEDGSNVPCLLIGNKCDLMKEGVIASETYVNNFCQKNNFLRWFETSAKENTNIATAIQYLITEIIRKIETAGSNGPSQNHTIKLTEEVGRNPLSRRCCQS